MGRPVPLVNFGIPLLKMQVLLYYNLYPMSKQRVIVIVGPTASGKSSLAVSLAKRVRGEVISADSRQVYRGLDIGTGKITAQEMRGIPHHLLDVASPRRIFTVARYQTLARLALRGIVRRGNVPIVCGGTGLYIDALLYDYPLPSVKPNLPLRKKLSLMDVSALATLLQQLDPVRYDAIDRRNPRRLIRAIEIAHTLGSVPKLTPDNLQLTNDFEVLKIGIQVSKEDLQKKIRARLTKRLQQGMIKEVQRLHASGLSWKRLEALGLEYRSLACHLQGHLTKQELVDTLQREIYQYAKRQMTWFTRDHSIHWISHPREAMALVVEFLK